MLNCGMYQSDIADLLQPDVEWTTGRIRRKRSKTSSHDDVPEVDYKLWDETFTLLTKHRSAADRVLLNSRGGPLQTKKIVDGKGKRTCNISTSMKRQMKKLGLRVTLKNIRKTSANKLEEHEVFGRYVSHFLGHSPRTIAEKHYITPSQEQFDRAISWLGEQFGFETAM